MYTGAEDSVESVPDVVARVRDHRRQLLSQLELLSDDHNAAQVLQRRFSLRHRAGTTTRRSIVTDFEHPDHQHQYFQA